jgi:hypothetical protein
MQLKMVETCSTFIISKVNCWVDGWCSQFELREERYSSCVYLVYTPVTTREKIIRAKKNTLLEASKEFSGS